MGDVARIRNRLRDREGQRMLAEENAILDVTEMICGLMDKKGVRRSDLAERMGVSRSSVSQLLNGDRNLTIRKIAAILFEMEHGLEIRPLPLPGAHHRRQRVIRFEQAAAHTMREKVDLPPQRPHPSHGTSELAG